MPNDLTQKAIKMILSGGTLLSEPCPYCKGVRVMKDGHALCVNCGKEPEQIPAKTGIGTGKNRWNTKGDRPEIKTRQDHTQLPADPFCNTRNSGPEFGGVLRIFQQ